MRALLDSMHIEHCFSFDIGCFVSKDSEEARALRSVWVGDDADVFRAHCLTYTKTLAWFLERSQAMQCLMLEDDVVVNPSSPCTLPEALAAIPDSRHATYLEWCYMECSKRRIEMQEVGNVRFAIGPNAVCTAAVVWSRAGAASFLEWMSSATRWHNIDQCTRLWNEHPTVEVAFTLPQVLVQDRAAFGGVSPDGLKIDYSSCVLKRDYSDSVLPGGGGGCIGVIVGVTVAFICIVAAVWITFLRARK